MQTDKSAAHFGLTNLDAQNVTLYVWHNLSRRLATRQIFLNRFILCFILVTGFCGALAAQQPDPQAVQQVILLKLKFQEELESGKIEAAVRSGEEMGQVAERAFASNPDVLGAVLSNLGQAYAAAGQPDKALAIDRRVLDLIRRSKGEASQYYVVALNNVATATASLGNYNESEVLFLKALERAETLKLPASPFVSKPLSNLSGMYFQQQRYAEAERACKRAIDIWLKDPATKRSELALCWQTLANVYARQKRPAEAETGYQRALEAAEAAWGKDHFQTCQTINDLAYFYLGQHRPAEAKPLFERLLAMQERTIPDSMQTAETAYWLAMVHAFDQHRSSEAERLLEKARQIYERSGSDNLEFASQLSSGLMGIGGVNLLQSMESSASSPESSAQEAVRLVSIADQALQQAERAFGAQDPRILEPIFMCAHWRVVLGELDTSEKLLARGFDIVASNGALVAPANKLSLLECRAGWQGKKGNATEAIADLKSAITIAESLRWNAGGTDQDRAKYAAQFVALYNKLALLLAKNGNASEAFLAMEAARNRILLRQMEAQAVDLLAGLPASQAKQLREKRLTAQNRVLQLEVEGSRLARDEGRAQSDIAANRRRVADELQQARQQFLNVQREIYNVSPAQQLAARSTRQAASLEEVQAWCGEKNTLLLEYVVHENESCVLLVSPNSEPQIVTLTLTEPDAETLEVKPSSPWNEYMTTSLAGQAGLAQALANASGTGVMQLLQRPATASRASSKLKALANIVLPSAVRAFLDPAKHQRVVIIPDGPLVDLPFEVLVLAGEESPDYLLDSCPPICYAPSTNVLLSLTQRPLAKNWQALPILSVANPQYETLPANASSPLNDLSPRARLAGAGQRLPALPHSGLESSWFLEVFKRDGSPGEALLLMNATEANVRHKIVDRRIVHFACHGLVDRNQGNLLGSLAITPGADAMLNPDNDGYLTLSEIYELNLRGCELVVLSACESNLGPQQRGEGSWALSRGFLVAGARRVVATNWLVDDEAAASLVSYFGASLATAEKTSGKGDVALALHTARRWVREQEKWRSPYFWGNFVLVGPY